MIDPSVTDESDPLSTRPDLEMYRHDVGYRMPPASSKYSEDFLVAYREAQVERVHRLDAIAFEHLHDTAISRRTFEVGGWTPDEAFRLERRAVGGRFMIVYRTLADPASVDMSIDQDDRFPVGMDGDPRPDLQNYSNMGPAHYLTPRAWLSTWSGLSSHANTVRSLSRVVEPTLIVHYTADWFARMRDADAMFDASAATDKTIEYVKGLTTTGVCSARTARRVSDSLRVRTSWPSGCGTASHLSREPRRVRTQTALAWAPTEQWILVR
jgi:hypothetical protein